MSDLADPMPATAAVLVPFPGDRRTRTAPPADECGRILLFTGVRYERMAEPDRDPATTGPAPRRRRSGGSARLKRQS